MADPFVFTSVNPKDQHEQRVHVNPLLPAGKAPMNNGRL